MCALQVVDPTGATTTPIEETAEKSTSTQGLAQKPLQTLQPSPEAPLASDTGAPRLFDQLLAVTARHPNNEIAPQLSSVGAEIVQQPQPELLAQQAPLMALADIAAQLHTQQAPAMPAALATHGTTETPQETRQGQSQAPEQALPAQAPATPSAPQPLPAARDDAEQLLHRAGTPALHTHIRRASRKRDPDLPHHKVRQPLSSTPPPQTHLAAFTVCITSCEINHLPVTVTMLSSQARSLRRLF